MTLFGTLFNITIKEAAKCVLTFAVFNILKLINVCFQIVSSAMYGTIDSMFDLYVVENKFRLIFYYLKFMNIFSFQTSQTLPRQTELNVTRRRPLSAGTPWETTALPSCATPYNTTLPSHPTRGTWPVIMYQLLIPLGPSSLVLGLITRSGIFLYYLQVISACKLKSTITLLLINDTYLHMNYNVSSNSILHEC